MTQFPKHRITAITDDLFDKWLNKFKKELLTFSGDAILAIKTRLYHAIRARVALIPVTPDYDLIANIVESSITPEQILIESVL